MKKIKTFFVVAILFAANTIKAQAQSKDKDLYKTILFQDSLFWNAYNSCDTEAMKKYLSDDLEFYHDKGGLMVTADKVIEVSKQNLCSNENFRLRRESVPESYQVFPMKNIGAILTGEHVFYIYGKDKPEQLDGIAKFTHLWEFRDNQWKMTRIFSYDHKPAPINYGKTPIELSEKQLQKYIGTYRGNHIKVIRIEKSEKNLAVEAGEFKGKIIPLSETNFYIPERQVIFEFVRANDRVTKLIVRENDKIVEEASKL